MSQANSSEIENHVVNHAVDNVVQRQIYRLVTKEQTQEVAAQLMDINSKILVNRILLSFGVPKEALSDGSAPTHTLIAARQCLCVVGRTCPGKTWGYFRTYQASALPMLWWEERLRRWGKHAQQSTCHLFISPSINNSLLRMRLNSNTFLCSCNETKPRWRWPNEYQRAWETGNREQRRKGIFQEQVRMAYLSNCNSTRHQVQLASNQGNLRSQISQSFHYKPHLKVRQLIASFLCDLCSKKTQNLIAVLFLICFY